jgi:hypothetical protein
VARHFVGEIESGNRMGLMTTDRVDFFALAIGFAISSCWSLVSGAVVVIGLRAFGLVVG